MPMKSCEIYFHLISTIYSACLDVLQVSKTTNFIKKNFLSICLIPLRNAQIVHCFSRRIFIALSQTTVKFERIRLLKYAWTSKFLYQILKLNHAMAFTVFPTLDQSHKASKPLLCWKTGFQCTASMGVGRSKKRCACLLAPKQQCILWFGQSDYLFVDA